MAEEIPVPSDDDQPHGGSPKAAKTAAGSAGRRRDRGGESITIADLQALLQQQSETIAKTQAVEIRGAVAELREVTMSEFRGIKSEMSRHADYISQLRDQSEKLEARVLALESRKDESSTAYLGSSNGDGHQKNLVILGGWDADTHRDDLLPELKELLGRIGVLERFQDIFTTGPRRGHAMGVVKWPAGQGEQELKRDLIRLVQEIRGASMASKTMPVGKTLWAALSKTRMERLRAGHAGKTKRLILEANQSEKHAMDVEWGAGSVWMRGQLISSATRPSPKGVETRKGKAPGAWIDIHQIARALGGAVTFVSWNIGGKAVDAAVAAIKYSSSVRVGQAIFAFQELPRVAVGWQTTKYDDKMLVQYREENQWRGNGIMFSPAEYVCLRRKASNIGVWLRLRQVRTGAQLWVCSARLSTGVSDAQTAEEANEVLSLRPPTALPSILLADFNTQLKWTKAAGERGQALPTTGRADYLFSELERRRYRLHPPGMTQWETPTSRPRRRGARGRQIDGVASSRTRGSVINIAEGSYKEIGGDHDRVHAVFSLGPCPVQHSQGSTKPRTVVGEIPIQMCLNQTKVQQLAESFTRPRKGMRYRDPSQVKVAFRRARQLGTEDAWKEAHRARRQARDEWLQAKVLRASQGSWKDMRDLRDTSGAEWAVHLTEEAYAQKRDPLKWTTDHFALLFQAATEDQVPVHWDQEGCDGIPFQVEELREVVNKGRNGRAVGLDLTSYELVKELCKDTTSEGSLLAWMESIRMGAPVPDEWRTTIITLLPKKPKPESPSDLRPISLSSAVSKVYGRQTSDYMFAIMRTFSLETEWRFGLSWLKLDISKAYDSIHRWKILEYLRSNLPPNMWREFESWKQLLEPGKAQVRTPWGLAYISQTRGIRQGSVESPFIFAVAMECALHKAQTAEEWPRTLGGAPDMALSSLLYMDDSILWDTSRESLERKFSILSRELKQWGLKVNPKKTVYYRSPHALSLPQIRLDGIVVQSSDALEVMGVRLAVPFKPAAVMDTGMAKARKKYFASREVLECRGPLKKRLQVFRTAVGGAALWYASAAPPNFQAMGALNTMQLELVARMAGHKRKPEESWLDFRMRSLRAARQILSNAGMERWSTTWLRRHWQYRGHVVRAASRDQPPASSVMDGYRTLAWWRRQQANRDGVRHPASFFPHLSNEEVRLNRAAGRAE
ncbi:unnamed protein product [Symbiodinium sp. KB8]|nr:unnamed protein product [Symbiodinium sp. KB8]